MKAIITKIFSWFKNLFLKLRVVVTLQCGREKLITNDKDADYSADSDTGEAVSRKELEDD